MKDFKERKASKMFMQKIEMENYRLKQYLNQSMTKPY
jgi:hypothetical protein